MNKYRTIGFKLTPQRLAILDYLEGNTLHPSADDIYRSVLKKFPTMSFATVYTTLAALKQKGKVLELTVDPLKMRYDPETKNHSHLFCDACNRIFDIPVGSPPELPEQFKRDFIVTKSHIEFRGICPECRKNSSEKIRKKYRKTRMNRTQ